MVKKSYTSINHGVGGSAGSHTLGVTAGDVLFFEFSSRDAEIIDIFPRFNISYIYNWYEDGSHTVFPSPYTEDPAFTVTTAGRGLHLAYGEQTVLNEAYRGWSYFGYNGNKDRAFDPINEDYLKIDSSYGKTGMPDAFVFIPNAEQGFSRWEAEDDAWITNTCISSSRMGTNYIALPGTGGGARGVPRIGKSTQSSYSAGVSVVNGSISTGQSESLLDFFDINGDRFPDIVGNGGIQFSNPYGGLEEAGESVVGYDSEIRNNANESTNLGVGMNPVQLIPNNRGTTGGSIVGEMATLMSPIGITLNLVAEGSSSAEKEMMDINGDGLPDIVRQNGSTLQVSLNLGYRFAPFENWGSAQIQESETEQAPFDFSFNPNFNVANYSFGGGVSLSNSGSYVEKSLADMNGDGLVDTVRSTGSTLWVGLNTGGGFLPEVEWHGGLTANISDTDNVTLGGSLYATISIYIPIPFTPGFTIVINPGGDINTSIGRNQSALRDVNGDGYTDHVTSDSTSRMNVALSNIGRTNKLKQIQRPLGASFTLSYKRDGNTYKIPQCKWVLSEVTVHDGHEGDGADTQTLTFDYADGYYDRYEREFFGYGSVTTERRDGEGTLYMAVTQEFLNDSYYNKGLLLKEQVADGLGNLYTVKTNQYRFFDINLSDVFVNQWPYNAIATVFPQLIRSESYFYEGETYAGTWTYSTFEYGDYGNITSFFDAGNIRDSSDDVEAVLTYHEDTTHYVVGKPESIRVYGDGGLLRRREGAFDQTTGALRELRQYLETGAASASTLDYYPNGNLKSVTGPPNYRNDRYSVNFEYDSVVNTHITKVTDSFGYTSQAEYNYLYGVDTTSRDVNGNVMSKVYDTFGRLLKVFSPYDKNDPAVEFFYSPGDFPPRAVTKNKIYFDPNNDETIDTVLFIDGLKRVIQTKKEGEVLVNPGDAAPTYGMNVTGKALFDFMGRVTAQGQPVFENGYNVESFSSISVKNPTLNEYDILGRTTKVTLPDASVITSAYSIEANLFKTRTIDPEDNARQMFKDIKENTVRIEQVNEGDPIITQYEYNPLNEIIKVIDDKDNCTNITYDMLGRRIKINNPDAGLTESFFDLAGNLRHKVDNNLREKNQQITYHYDYNRLAVIDYPESPDVTYTYGEPGAAYNRAGRITDVADESGFTEFFYGKLGEELKTVKTMNFLVPGHDAWTFESEAGYDYLGRVQWLTYPDGEKLVYEYDQGGQITSAFGEKHGDLYYYVKKIFYDEFGQRAYIKYGNDVETHYTYDPYRRWLDSINTENSGGEVFQDNEYSFDKVGNVLGITNRARDITQTYAYDDIYQLVRAQGESPDKNKTSTYTQTFAYDSIGNILHKTSEHSLTPGNEHPKELNYDFTYLYNGERPHAPTQIGNWTYEYDGNGNTIYKERIVGNEAKDTGKESGQTDGNIEGGGTSGTYIWNEENRLTEAKVNGRSTYFLYNAGGERTVKRGQHGESLYVNTFYQLQNRSEVTKHVFVGTSRIVSKLSHFHNKNGLYDSGYERKNIYFYHPDHLGSSNYITGPDGREFEHIEYTPYGETWVDEGTNKNVIGYRFTSKELDTETGLYYFGARYLDPKVGRWMSVDPAFGDYLPVAPVSDKAKEHNRNLPGMGGVFNAVNLAVYHYSGNNSVKLVDPDGKEGTLAELTRLAKNIRILGIAGGIDLQLVKKNWDLKNAEDGCFARAYIIAKRLEDAGFEVGGFVDMDSPPGYEFHTAAFVVIEGEKYIVDPMLSFEPLTFEDWAKKQNKDESDITIKALPRIIELLDDEGGEIDVVGYPTIEYEDKIDFCIQFLKLVNDKYNGGIIND